MSIERAYLSESHSSGVLALRHRSSFIKTHLTEPQGKLENQTARKN